MKVLFLDIDGVLNTREFIAANTPTMLHFAGWGFAINPKNVEKLTSVLRATGAKVVLSSTWRIHVPLDELQAFLRAYGCPVEFIGRTPLLGGDRGGEVSAWLDRKAVGLGVTAYAIVDDRDDFPGHTELVQTDPAEGLTWQDADALVRMLGFDG